MPETPQEHQPPPPATPPDLGPAHDGPEAPLRVGDPWLPAPDELVTLTAAAEAASNDAPAVTVTLPAGLTVTASGPLPDNPRLIEIRAALLVSATVHVDRLRPRNHDEGGL